MTTAEIHFPIRELSPKAQKAFLYRDPRNSTKIKGRSFRLRGRHGGKGIPVSFVKQGKYLRVRCSLFKAISGQNAITHPNLPMAVRLTFDYVIERLQEEFKCNPPEIDEDGDIKISFVDLVWHFVVGERRDVRNLLSKIYADQSNRPGHILVEPAVLGGGYQTVKISFLDLELTVKFYDKFEELHQPGHRLPRAISDREELLKLTEGWVRMEVSVSLKALKKRNLVNLANWTPETRKKIFEEIMQALQLDGTFESVSSENSWKKLSRKLQLTYLLWEGEKGFENYPASTLAAHRKELKKRLGIDIRTRPPKRQKQHVAIREIFTEARRVVITKEQLARWVPCWAEAPTESK